MAEHALQDALHLVFTNLNYKDLHNASLVCRYWSKIAKQENCRRGVVSNILYNDDINVTTIGNWEKEYFEHLIKMSGFNVFVVNVNYKGRPISNCYCKHQKPTCCSLILKLNSVNHSKKFAMCMTFPISHKIHFNAITFERITWEDLVYSPELRFLSGPIFQTPPEMERMIRNYFDKNSPMKSCMILISDISCTGIISNVFESLKKWFPESDIFIWGGVVKETLLCKNLKCKRLASCIFIFISSKNLKTWVTSWSAINESEEIIKKNLQEFKQRIVLKKHSIALIYRACNFLPISYSLEVLFQTVFPKMPYIYLYGPALLGAENSQVIFQNMTKYKTFWQKGPTAIGIIDNSIMILTYN